MAHEYYSSKKWNSAICNNMDGARGYYTETKIAIILEIDYSSVKKENVAYTYRRLLLNLKREGNFDTCYNMNEPRKHHAKWNKPDTKGQTWSDSMYMGHLE